MSAIPEKPTHTQAQIVRAVKAMNADGREIYEYMLDLAKELELDAYGQAVPLRAAGAALTEAQRVIAATQRAR